jgi:hypothetical protein
MKAVGNLLRFDHGDISRDIAIEGTQQLLGIHISWDLDMGSLPQSVHSCIGATSTVNYDRFMKDPR